VIFGDQYAGTWDGGDHGGHLFGRIVRVDKKEADKKENVAPASKK
jgi:hypothetical protein